MNAGHPLYSFIVPVWNREGTVRRCLDSILSQTFDDFEIVAVDDGSSDASLAVLRTYCDPRVHVVPLKENCGVSVARNSGAAVARGDWLVYLDSDDALLPGGLAACHDVIKNVPPNIGIVGFSYETDQGLFSPDPLPPEGFMDLKSYLRWMRTARTVDYLPFHRKECWEKIKWPNNRATEGMTTLRLVARFGFVCSRKKVGCVYTDAQNRYNSPSMGRRPLLSGEDSLSVLIAGLDDIGPMLKTADPAFYAVELRSAAILCFGCRRSWMGTVFALRSLMQRPWSLTAWTVLFIGLIHPALLARIREKRKQRNCRS